MGFSILGSSGSKSTSTSNNYNQAQTIDLSSNGMGDTSKNVVVGANGSYNVDGLSEDLVKTTFDGFNAGFNSLIELAGSVFKTNENLQNTNMQNLASVYGEAYGTQKSQAESLKTYAFYALVGIIAVSFIHRARR